MFFRVFGLQDYFAIFYYTYNVWGGGGAVRTSRPLYRNIFIHDYPFPPYKK